MMDCWSCSGGLGIGADWNCLFKKFIITLSIKAGGKQLSKRIGLILRSSL